MESKTNTDIPQILHPNYDGPASSAFILDNVEFFNHDKQPLDNLTGLTLDNILYFKLRFKNEKNGRNFEIIPYYKDLDNPKFCPSNVIFRIVQQAQRFNLPTEDQLGVFWAITGCYKGDRYFISNSHVAKFLQEIAATV